MPGPEDDDARHRREEQERKAKRKAHKASKSDAQKEKDRQRREYRQNILKQHGHATTAGSAEHPSKKQKLASSAAGAGAESGTTGSGGVSEFQKLFEQRAQGFQIDFRFRNAPPRPPVGPCFVGQNLDAVLLQQHAQHYRALNSVEVDHRWRLHNESDLGVPLAPSAMDLKSYTAVNKGGAASQQQQQQDETARKEKRPLHKDDEALLHWKGHLGDSAAEELKQRRDRARAAARAAAAGRPLPPPLPPPKSPAAAAAAAPTKSTKKSFSRVLKQDGAMPTFMKKTTYLSNDYSRKVHDFKSLAQTKQQLAKDLEQKQVEMSKRRSKQAVTKLFDHARTVAVVHPTKKTLKPKRVLSVLPAVEYWGMPFTHLIVDKKPTNLPDGDRYPQSDFSRSLVANVEKPSQTARMTCDVFAPSRRTLQELQEGATGDNDPQPQPDQEYYEAIQAYDLDVVPLKDEDAPHVHFCLAVDRERGVASYIPISSRIQLSTGRPASARQAIVRPIVRRAETHKEQTEREERAADVDLDLAEKHGIDQDVAGGGGGGGGTQDSDDSDQDDDDDNNKKAPARTTNKPTNGTKKATAAANDDDGEDDFGDDDDDDDDMF